MTEEGGGTKMINFVLRGGASWSSGLLTRLRCRRSRVRIQLSPPLVPYFFCRITSLTGELRHSLAIDEKRREEEERVCRRGRTPGDAKRSRLPRWRWRNSEPRPEGKEDVQQDEFVKRIRKVRWREYCSNSHGTSNQLHLKTIICL